MSMYKIPVTNKGVIWRNLNGEAVLLNPEDGKYFGLNSVGCSFWEKIDDSRSLAEIIDLLLEEYEVKREVLARDLELLLHEMEKRDLIVLK